MADVLFVCVHRDVSEAEGLAEVFEAAGFSVDDATDDAALRACSAVLIVMSDAALRVPAFREATERAVHVGKAVIASLMGDAVADVARVFDISEWNGGGDDPSIEPLLATVERMVRSAHATEQAGRRSCVIDLDARRYADDASAEPPMSAAWLASLPTAHAAQGRDLA